MKVDNGLWTTEGRALAPLRVRIRRVADGVAAALAAAVVGAARSRPIVRRTTTRRRWLAVLALLCFISVYSPSNSLTSFSIP